MVGYPSGKTFAGVSDKLIDITFVLDWYPNAIHSYLYAAQEKGYFKDAGLNVTLLVPAQSSDPLTLVATGKADIGTYYTTSTIIALANEDVPVVSIATLTQGSLGSITALASSGFESPADFKGKIIGYPGGEPYDMINVLKSVGLDKEDVTFVNVGWDSMTALSSKRADVVLGCWINHEILYLNRNGYETKSWFVSDYGVPLSYSLVYVANKNKLNQKREAYAKFLEAVTKDYEFVKQNPQKGLDLVLNNQDSQNFPLEKDIEAKSLSIVSEIFTRGGKKFLTTDPDIWQQNIEYLYDNNIIKKKVAVSDVVVELIK
jgi:putative hydroxymethylpyrimidine transport system substrate-binding protein